MTVIGSWTGWETRALREALRMSVRGFASHLGIAVRTVAKWEQRSSTITLTRDMQEILDAALRCADAESTSRFALLCDRCDERKQEAVEHEKITAMPGTALTALSRPAVLELAARTGAAQERGHIDERVLIGHEEVSAALAGLYRNTDPRAALSVAVVNAESSADLLGHAMSEKSRRRLFPLVVGVHAQIGLWACHMNALSTARAYLAAASEYASRSGDRVLHACALGALSYLYSSAPRGGCGGEPHRALALLDQAIESLGQKCTFTTGWLRTWRADQYATMGEVLPAQRDLDAAARGLASPLDDADGFFARSSYGYGMDGHLRSVLGLVEALSGRSAEAARTFHDVCGSAANSRRVTATKSHIALAQVRRNDPEAACHALSTAIALGVRDGYDMGVTRAAGVRAGFRPEWASLGCVLDLDESLRHAVATTRHTP